MLRLHGRTGDRTEPSPAERARTALVLAPTVEIVTFGTRWTVAHHGVAPDGAPLLHLPADHVAVMATRAARTPVRVVLHAAHLHPRPGPDRVRHRVRMRGMLVNVRQDAQREVLADGRVQHIDALDGCSIVRIEPEQVCLDGYAVAVADYRAAAPDPLAAVEEAQLVDLERHHTHQLAGLCTLLGPDALIGATGFTPVALDRYGLTLRVTRPDGQADHRLGFPRPVDRLDALHRALHRMIPRARTGSDDGDPPPPRPDGHEHRGQER